MVFVMVLCCLFIGRLTAQTPAPTKMNAFCSKPEWDSTEVCGANTGYVPSIIPAPSVSYSGTMPKDGMYDYVWEQRLENGPWVQILSGKSVPFVPACRLKALRNAIPGNKPQHYEWRLQMKDIANGFQVYESPIFSLTVVSPLAIDYSIQPSTQQSGLFNVDAKLSGGLKTKKISWSSADPKNKLSDAQRTMEDPQGLQVGDYELTVEDGCSTATQKIIISTNTLSK